ncbi:MAG TPA: cytochrome c biogenesis protein CcdA [Bacteroidales bacterium]|nr:cytochrome c biogenesis protein CcdA [Bacteroidales bacterium]
MRKRALLLLLLISGAKLYSQVQDPVSWSFKYDKTGDNTYEIVMTAGIDQGWHMYSMEIPADGPIATSFVFGTAEGYSASGGVYAVTKPEIKFDQSFGMNIGMYAKSAEFRQKIEVKTFPSVVKGTVTFMSCNDKECLPPRDVEFSVIIKGNEKAVASTEAPANPVAKEGLLRFFLLALLAGFVGVLTPCVFPMIPMTVAFFSQGSENKRSAITKALIFGISIVLIYSSLGIIVSLSSAGAGFANTLSTHWIPNLIFFTLFIVFALSFFGAYEIVLPSSWVSSSDSKVDKGGALAAFFLGLTTVLVSFSCTGPIVGALLVEAASGDVLRPTIGMFGFGLAFALPFTLFALFPSLMDKLPKSGGWLNSVKIVMGLLMVAFSLKFASAIDSVYSFGILSRDVYLLLWMIIFIILGLYLLGVIRFKHDSPIKKMGPIRLLLTVASFGFVFYLGTGLFGSPLTRLSGLLPAQETAGFNLMKTLNKGKEAKEIKNIGNPLCEAPKYADILKFEFGLQGYFDLEQALNCGKKVNKPVLIDFKGHACANCKKMDARVWSDPEVQKKISENFVLVGLYLDDRTSLPANEVFVSKIDGKEKKTLGKKNEDIEITMFNTNSLPLYAIVDTNGKPLVEPRGTDFDVKAYIEWLDKGINEFNK